MIAVRCGTSKTATLLLLACRTCSTGYIRTATVRNGCYTSTITRTTTAATVRGVWTTMTTGNVAYTIDATTRQTTTIVAAAVTVLSVVMMRLT